MPASPKSKTDKSTRIANKPAPAKNVSGDTGPMKGGSKSKPRQQCSRQAASNRNR